MSYCRRGPDYEPSRGRASPQRCSKFLWWVPAYVQTAGLLGDDRDEALGLALYEETGLHKPSSLRIGALLCESQIPWGDA